MYESHPKPEVFPQETLTLSPKDFAQILEPFGVYLSDEDPIWENIKVRPTIPMIHHEHTIQFIQKGSQPYDAFEVGIKVVSCKNFEIVRIRDSRKEYDLHMVSNQGALEYIPNVLYSDEDIVLHYAIASKPETGFNPTKQLYSVEEWKSIQINRQDGPELVNRLLNAHFSNISRFILFPELIS